MAAIAVEAREYGDARGRRNSLIEQNLPLVVALARRFAGRGERLDDLVQVGAIGLIHAVDRFDAARGDFRAYAVPTIVGEIKRHLRDRTGSIRVPRRDQQARGALQRARRDLRERLNRSPTWSELTSLGAVAEDAAARALAAERAIAPVSLSGISERFEPSVEDEGLAAGENRALVREAFEALTPRERAVVSLAYFGGMSQRELAASIGISQSHASRLLVAALAKMRASLGLDSPL
jgi:RNA polymerase sigma-B factor